MIAGAVGGWVGNLVAQRIIGRWEKNREQSLEELREQIARDQAIFSASIQSYSSGYQFAQERRLAAIDAIWEKIRELDRYASLIMFAYTLPRNTILSSPEIRQLLSTIDKKEIGK